MPARQRTYFLFSFSLMLAASVANVAIMTFAFGWFAAKHEMLAATIQLTPEAPSEPQNTAAYFREFAPMLFHAGFGSMVLLMGPFQLLSGWTRLSLPLHRLLGTLYAAGLTVSILAGLVTVVRSPGSPLGMLIFIVLAILGLGSLGQAYIQALSKQLKAHQKWAQISYGVAWLTSTFWVWWTLLLYLPFIR